MHESLNLFQEREYLMRSLNPFHERKYSMRAMAHALFQNDFGHQKKLAGKMGERRRPIIYPAPKGEVKKKDD